MHKTKGVRLDYSTRESRMGHKKYVNDIPVFIAGVMAGILVMIIAAL